MGIRVKKVGTGSINPSIGSSSISPSRSLRDIMDYTQPLRIIYSGVENEEYYNILYECGIRNFLMSYHYINDKHINMGRFEGTNVRLMIDSGAYTYQKDPKYANTTDEEWESHLQKYLKWAEKHKDVISFIVNFDFEGIVESQTVDRWNREYFEPFMLKTGIPVCFVWHKNSYQSWDFYCQRYPYVGMSFRYISDSENGAADYFEKIKIAEKYNTLVHGFGITRTSLLTDLPFYTVDSTTWLVGLQYGEINYWTPSNKMSRLKKDKWKKSYLDTICSRYGLDSEKLLNEDVSEMIKANVYAFMDAEKYIQEKLKSRMYWMKPHVVKRDIYSLPENFFPPLDWLADPDYATAQEYAKKMNINAELPEKECIDTVWMMTVFLNWDNPEYAPVREIINHEIIVGLHDSYINRVVGTDEERVQDLILFFQDCLSGNNDKLLLLGTNFDRIVKERDSYIEDDEEEEFEDLSPEEVRMQLSRLLPSPEDGNAPEIDELDEEIYRKADIVPVFDERGKFVKGQKAVRKPKAVYSKKYPKFACDTCYASAKCPEYKAGYVCAYNKMFNRFDTRDMVDIIQAIQGIVEHNLARMQRAMILEVMNGNIDPVTSQLMDTNIRYLQMLKQMYEYGSPEVLRQTRVVRADGSREESTMITNPQSGGILEKLFGDMMNKNSGEEEKVGKKSSIYDNLDKDD